MKRCPACDKKYDDTWKVCLECESDLVSAGKDTAPDGGEAKAPRPKTPNGVVIIAWWTIITSVLGVLTIQASMAVNPPASTIFYLVISPVSIVAAVFLLKYKEWARITIVIISLLIVAETLITTPYAAGKMKADMMSQLETGYQKGIESAKSKDPKVAQADPARLEEMNRNMRKIGGSVADIVIAVLVTLSVLFYLGIAYYFSLAKIRGYFS